MPKASDLNVSIDDPEVRAIAERVFETVRLSVQRGFASHRDDGLPVPAGSIEAAALRMAKNLSKTSLDAVAEKSLAALRKTGGLVSQLDLASPMPLVEQVDAKLDPLPLDPKRSRGVRISDDGPDSAPELALNFDATAAVEKVRERQEELFAKKLAKELAGGVKLSPIAWKHLASGGDKGPLGKATGPERAAPGGRGRSREYQHGAIYWTKDHGAHEVHGAIFGEYVQLGGPTGLLGFPVTDEWAAPDSVGRFNHFEHGSIYWTPKTGAHEVHGGIRNKWAELGWERGYLGYPVTDECITPDTIGRFSHFEGGSVYWTPQLGAHAVNVHVRNGWENEGWEVGFLGYPISSTDDDEGVLVNKFEGGLVRCKPGSAPKIERPFTKFAIRLHKIRCEVETDGWGDDEIALGCVVIDELGKVTKTKQFYVGDFSDDDDDNLRAKRYDPPKALHEFNVADTGGWPKTFLCLIVLCEEDTGGFADDLQAILKKIGEVVANELEKSAKAIGAAVGTLVGALAGNVIGAVIGAIVGFVVGALVDWLMDVIEDDTFVPIPVKAALRSVHQRWDGKTNSTNRDRSAKGHGGRYTLWLDWELRA